ncbi:MAG: mechanosensitive ion channel family protein [Flavobacteriales bacterium]|nr:mechanosensitive ion channel family protein [Flavobacteriales bacterium]
MQDDLEDAAGTLVQAFQKSWYAFLDQVPEILLAILIVAVGLLVSNKLAGFGRKVIERKSQDPLMTNFLTKTIKLVLGVIVVMFAMRVAGLDGIATGLLTAAGASAVIIGFAFKDIGENFISGVILSFNRPFNLNDTVEVGDIFGKVTAMEFRYTKLKTFDGRDVYIPNSDVVKKPVFNYTEDGFYRVEFMAGIAYEDKIDDARDLIMKTVRGCEGVVEDDAHEVFVAVDELAVSTVNLKVRFWVETKDYRKRSLMIRGRVITEVKQALETNGFSLPADIQEIKLYGGQSSIPVTVTQGAVKGAGI